MDMILPIAMSIAAFCFFVAAHTIIWRYASIKKKGVYLIIKISVFSYLFVTCLGIFYFGIGPADHAWTSCPVFMLLIMLYLHFYVGMDRSISIRILGELVKTPTGRINLNALQLVYPKEYMVKHRIGLLVENKWLSEKDGRYSCTVKGSLVAKAAVFFEKIYSLTSTE